MTRLGWGWDLDRNKELHVIADPFSSPSNWSNFGGTDGVTVLFGFEAAQVRIVGHECL